MKKYFELNIATFRKCLSLISVIGLAAHLGFSGTLNDEVAFQMPGRDLRQNPPKVASISIVPMGVSGKGELGLLKIRFEESGLPKSLKFFFEGTVKTLHDDGLNGDEAKDGVYSTLVDFNLGEIADFQTQLKASGQKSSSVPSGLAPASKGELSISPLSVIAGLDDGKVLFVRSTSVVNNALRTSDPCLSTSKADSAKKWTFGYLMTQMANQSVTGISPSKLALSLLKNWETNKSANTLTIPGRLAIKDVITNKWLRASGNNGTLTMHKAPFRLLGIVNRIDLRQNLFFGEGIAGELRFVWGVLDLENTAVDGTCQENPSFTMIMEFAVDKKTQDEVKAWGQKWVALNSLTLNSSAYLSGLQNITESVVKAGLGTQFGRANGSELIRIRSNEIALSSPWELREFNIAKSPRADAGLFFSTTVKQSPSNEFNGTTVFRDFVNNNEASILAGTHKIPNNFNSKPFLGSHSLNNIDFWSAPGINNNEARHRVSVNTCNGCHGAETNTSFLQVFPRPRNQPSQLAGFLTGIDVRDPVDGTIVRNFNDLARRAIELNSLVNSPTLSQLSFSPTNRTE